MNKGQKARKTAQLLLALFWGAGMTIWMQFWAFPVILGLCMYLGCLTERELLRDAVGAISRRVKVSKPLAHILFAASLILGWPVWAVAIVWNWWI